MANILKVAQKICELSNYQTTNLRLQKQLYIAQLLSLGVRDQPLFPDEMQAWQYGPVSSRVYDRVNICGADSIQPFIFDDCAEDDGGPLTEDDVAFLGEVVNSTKRLKDWELVGLTHREGSAWAKAYKERPYKTITHNDMRAEYNTMWKKSNG